MTEYKIDNNERLSFAGASATETSNEHSGVSDPAGGSEDVLNEDDTSRECGSSGPAAQQQLHTIMEEAEHDSSPAPFDNQADDDALPSKLLDTLWTEAFPDNNELEPEPACPAPPRTMKSEAKEFNNERNEYSQPQRTGPMTPKAKPKAKAKGKAQGKAKGKAQGKAKGKGKGRAKGKAKAKAQA